MKRLLADYIFDDNLRYESHTLIYTEPDGIETMFEGIVGAAILCTLLAQTDEGDERGIELDTPEQRNAFFERYELEVRRDNGGIFSTEVEQLNHAYIELTGSDENLFRICRNDRLYDLAVGLVMEYMQRLVIEQVGAHIYDAVPWRMPFAQWLFDAGYAETQRQHLLSVNWTDPAAVYALAQELQTDRENSIEPTFFFEREEAELLMHDYFRWLWTQVQAQAAMMPDAKARLAQLKPFVLNQETNLDFIKPELKNLAPEDLNLFRKWMNQWTDFITKQLGDANQPHTECKKVPNQELFLDKVLPVPEENSYVAVREYIQERCRYDKDFKTYYSTRTLAKFCEQLTILFGWYVNPNHLGKRLNCFKRR